MKGTYEISIKSKKANYDFTLNRNITVLEDTTSTGKTLLCNIIREYNKNKNSAKVSSKVPLKVLNNEDWKIILDSLEGYIVFIGEPDFLEDPIFIDRVSRSDNYFVIITRNIMHQIPYSFKEVYSLHKSGKFITFRSVYQSNKEIMSIDNIIKSYDIILIEDSKAWFYFFSLVFNSDKLNPADGKFNIPELLVDKNKKYLVIADGASFGNETQKIKKSKIGYDCKFILPESFEYCILKSNIFALNSIKKIMINPSNYIDSKNWVSWERFFTGLLIKESRKFEKYKRYSKNSLSDWYISEPIRTSILEEFGIVINNDTFVWD